MTAFGDEDVGRLDVAVHDFFGVRGIERIGDFDGQREQGLGVHGLARDAMLQRHAVQKLHGDEGLAVLLADVVNGADVGMIQGGCGLGFALETGEGLRVAGNFLGQKLEGDKTMKPGVFGFVDHAHAAAAQLLENAVVRNRLRRSLAGNVTWGKRRKSKNGVGISGPCGLRKTIFCRGGILRGWRIAGRAIRHSLSSWALGWQREWPLQRRRMRRLKPNLPERDELPRHCRVRRARCRPSTTCLRCPAARSWRRGRARFCRRAVRPAKLPCPVPARAKGARRSLAYSARECVRTRRMRSPGRGW